MTSDTEIRFDQLALSAPLLKALTDVGYETPSPIQAQTIPLMLEGRDVLGQAQTGTGKTAAFALPVLNKLDLKQQDPQVLVLAPTRELAIQVAEAFQTYATHIKGFHVLPVYGGQDYSGQIRALKRGVHVVVGTPGRVMDHMRRGTLKLNGLTTLVLDEADEMLRMGFIDDVEWILQQTPPTRQVALFSATMPPVIRKIANQHLNNPAEVTIKMATATADLIRQRFWPVSGMHKLDALTRILEAETFDAMLIFVRTRIVTVELAEKLAARGFAATALNGDIPQNQRERTIDQLKKGKLDILVATDVAARGLDVDRISHVVNYDIPHDTEAYIHRIGRTGRAGRQGDAILFVAPRERRMLNAIERATNKKIEMMELPSTELINDKRIQQFKQSIADTLAGEDLKMFTELVEQYQQDHNVTVVEIAAALARMVQGDVPLLLQHKATPRSDLSWSKEDRGSSGRDARGSRSERPSDGPRGRDRDSEGGRGFRDKGRGREDERGNAGRGRDRDRPSRATGAPDKGMERFRIEVGRDHNVQPGNIVGAIANEAGIDAKNIGRINIFDDHSTVDLPAEMPNEIFFQLKKVWVSGQTLNISRESAEDKPPKSKSSSFRKSGEPGEKNFKKGKPQSFSKTGESGESNFKKGKTLSFSKPGESGENNPKKSKPSLFSKSGDDKKRKAKVGTARSIAKGKAKKEAKRKLRRDAKPKETPNT